MSLSFLKEIKVEDNVTRRSGGGPRKHWVPELPLAIRIWKKGEVFPSQGLIDRFELEYQPKDSEAPGNGFDVFLSKNSEQFKSDTPLIMVNVTSRANGKIDLFGSVGFDDKNAPKVKVIDQGAATFGQKTLLGWIKETYGVEPNDTGFIDLVLLGTDGEPAQQPFKLPEGKKIGFIPKSISKGEEKGKATYKRRENPEVYVLYPYILINPDGAAQQEADANNKIHDASVAELAAKHPDAVAE